MVNVGCGTQDMGNKIKKVKGNDSRIRNEKIDQVGKISLCWSQK
jgi:hypothetical protein